jgi:hypothetical protein
MGNLILENLKQGLNDVQKAKEQKQAQLRRLQEQLEKDIAELSTKENSVAAKTKEAFTQNRKDLKEIFDIMVEYELPKPFLVEKKGIILSKEEWDIVETLFKAPKENSGKAPKEAAKIAPLEVALDEAILDSEPARAGR